MLCAMEMFSMKCKMELTDHSIIDIEMSSKVVHLTPKDHAKRLYKKFSMASKTRSVVMEGAVTPTSERSAFQDLFSLYFSAVYSSGMAIQQNWHDAARWTSEELVRCWTAAEISYEQILKMVEVVVEEKKRGKREKKYKNCFKNLFDLLMQHKGALPPSLMVATFVKDTMGHCEAILDVKKEEQKRLKEQQERNKGLPLDVITIDSDIKSSSPVARPSVDTDDTDSEAVVRALKKVNEELDDQDLEQSLQECDMETLRQKQLELEANIAAHEQVDKDENGESHVDDVDHVVATDQEGSDEHVDDDGQEDAEKDEVSWKGRIENAFLVVKLFLDQENETEVTVENMLEDERILEKFSSDLNERCSSHIEAIGKTLSDAFASRYQNVNELKQMLIDKLGEAFNRGETVQKERQIEISRSLVASFFAKIIALAGFNDSSGKSVTKEKIETNLSEAIPKCKDATMVLEDFADMLIEFYANI